MPIDIELSELTASGNLEPKADWTNLARAHVSAALKAELAEKNDALIVYRQPKDEKTEHLHQQLIKLHSAVGLTIIKHKILANKVSPSLELPTKQDKFDWSLGRATTVFRQDDADYGLFVYIRDSYTSAGRVALIVVAAILRVGVSGGQTSAFASLVDLRTGDVVWFNLLGSGSANLRTAETAREVMKELLTDLPL